MTTVHDVIIRESGLRVWLRSWPDRGSAEHYADLVAREHGIAADRVAVETHAGDCPGRAPRPSHPATDGYCDCGGGCRGGAPGALAGDATLTFHGRPEAVA